MLLSTVLFLLFPDSLEEQETKQKQLYIRNVKNSRAELSVGTTICPSCERRGWRALDMKDASFHVPNIHQLRKIAGEQQSVTWIP